MKYLLAFLLFASTALGQLPYVSAPTNAFTDGYIVKRTGTSGGHNKWSQQPYFITNGTGITFTTNGEVINITATGTNAASVTNVVLREGIGVRVVTNAPTDWTVSSLWETNSSDGGITNRNNTQSGIVEVGNATTTLNVDNQGTGAILIMGNTNLFRVGGSGNLDRIRNVPYTWPSANASSSGLLLSSTTSGVLQWTNAPIAAGTNITLTTNGPLITISQSNTNLPVVVAGTNVTVATNGLAYTVSASGGGGGGSNDVVIAGTNVTVVTNLAGSVTTYTVSSTGGGGGGGGVGPGTSNYISRFNSTLTNVIDSFMDAPATNLLIYRSRPVGSGYTNQWTNTWITSTSGSDANMEGLQIVAGNSTAGQRQVEIKSMEGSVNSNALVPLVLNRTLTIEPFDNQLGGHSAGAIYPTDLVSTLGDSSHRFLSGEFGSQGITVGVASGAPNLRSALSGTAFGFGLANVGIAHWYHDGASWNPVVTFNKLGIGGNFQLDLGVNSISGGSALGVTTSWFTPVANGAWYLGALNTGTSPTNQTIRGANGSGTDKPGNAVDISGGASTGAGTNGYVGIQTASRSGTGSGVNTLQPRLRIWGDPINLTTNSATTVCTFTVPTSLTCVGAKFSATTEIKDATDIASVYETFAITALNKAGTVTATNSVPFGSSGLNTGSAGIANTWTVTVSSTTVSIKCTCVTSGINATTARVYGRIELDSDGVSVVTFQ